MALQAFHDDHLEQLARVLAETATHPQLTDILARERFEAPSQGEGPKWRRLLDAMRQRQRRDRSGTAVGNLVQVLLNPVRFVGRGDTHEELRQDVNIVLAFSGLAVGEDGKLVRTTASRTIDQAEQRARRLRAELERRSVHPDILRFCRAELVRDNYFHAVLEASKSVADKLRSKSGLTSDGAQLVQSALGGAQPRIAINTLATDTEQSEQRGFMNLLVGLFGTFRNPTAHAPRISWSVSEQDALDFLCILSYIHRRIDQAARTPWS